MPSAALPPRSRDVPDQRFHPGWILVCESHYIVAAPACCEKHEAFYRSLDIKEVADQRDNPSSSTGLRPSAGGKQFRTIVQPGCNVSQHDSAASHSTREAKGYQLVVNRRKRPLPRRSWCLIHRSS